MANGNMQGMGMMAPPAQPMQEQASMPVVDMNSFQQSFSNLSDESNKVLEQHLTPPLKKPLLISLVSFFRTFPVF